MVYTTEQFFSFFLDVGSPKENIFLTPFYGLYFSHHYTYYNFFANVCLSDPTSPPRSLIGLVQCVSSYTLSSPSFKGVARGMNIFHMLDLCGQLSCTATMILVQSSTPFYAHGLSVAYLPYARTLTARAVNSNLSLEKPLSLCRDSNP